MTRRPNFRDRFMPRVYRDRDVFFETFGERHTGEGEEIWIVVDDFELLKRQIKQGIKVEEFGISDSQIHFYAKREDLPPRKPSGNFIDIEGRIYIISDWREDEGIFEITASISMHM